MSEQKKIIDDEILIREYIRREIAKQDKQSFDSNSKTLEEQWAVNMSIEEFDSTFVDPWINVLKVIGKEYQRTLANIVVNIRLFFTFNSKKAEEVLARHNDRIAKIDSELEEVLGPLRKSIKGDGALIAMVLNPGAYLLSKAVERNTATKVGNWFMTAGIGDFEAGEIESTDRESERLAREREQQGPVKKAIRALNDIFLLAHHEIEGDKIVEQEEKPKEKQAEPKQNITQITPEEMQKAVKATGLDKISKQAKEGFNSTFAELDDALNGFSSQIDILSQVALSKNFEELDTGISKIKSAVPKLDTSELTKFKTDIEKQVNSLLKDEEKLKGLVADMMKSKGSTGDVSDEEIKTFANDNKADIEKFAYQTIFMGNTSELRTQLVGQLDNSFKVYKDLTEPFSKVPQVADAAIQKIINDSEFAKKAADLKNLFITVQNKLQSAVSQINSFKPPKSLVATK